VDIPLAVQGKNLLPILKGEGVPSGEFDVVYSKNGFSGLYWQNLYGLILPEEGACKPDYSTFGCLNTWTQSVPAIRFPFPITGTV
jgi:hypothetical protein